MPRHDPDYLPSDEPGPVGRRLSSAVRAHDGTGLLGQPPLDSSAVEQGTPEDPPGRCGARIRWRTGRRAATLVCLASMALLIWFWWQAANVTATVSPISAMDSTEYSEATVPESESGSTADANSASGGSGDSPPGTIIVHVAGAVLRAGIVELPEGSRLHEAIAAAGGSATDADPDQLNLAGVLEDGQKVLVPRQGETAPAGSAAAGGPAAGDTSARGSPTDGEGSPSVAGKINLNTAGPDELAALPRVGPVLAQRIVDWRVQHGKFQRVEELDAVDGIGPKLLAALLPLVRV